MTNSAEGDILRLKEHEKRTIEIAKATEGDAAQSPYSLVLAFEKESAESGQEEQAEEKEKAKINIEKSEQGCQLQANWWVGLDWLQITSKKAPSPQSAGPAADQAAAIALPKIALQIEPKMELDQMAMLSAILKSPEACSYLGSSYKIHFDRPAIAVKSEAEDLLTPLLIRHYISLLKNIVRRGLKRGYYPVDENLRAKIKGKIDIGKTLRRNIATSRLDMTCCRYQRHGLNCAENRLLKKALLVALRNLSSFFKAGTKNDMQDDIKDEIAYCKAPFAEVSEEINHRAYKLMKLNPLFYDYRQALQVAQWILRRFDYSIRDSQDAREIPPHWIDMSKLFELYVYTKLLENKEKEKENDKESGNKGIEYQFNANYGYPDFLDLDKRMVIDAKYKPQYDPNYERLQGDSKHPSGTLTILPDGQCQYKPNGSGEEQTEQTQNSNNDKDYYDIADIRQISGYARDKKVLGILEEESQAEIVPQCLIIYPIYDSKDSATENGDSEERGALYGSKKKITQFRKFYRLGILLPSKK